MLTTVVAGMVSVIAVSATLGQAVSTLTFRSQFTAFAERADPTDNSADDRFWIGPFAYNRQCIRETAVFVWHDDDSFFNVPAVRIGADGSVSQVMLDEYDPVLTCRPGG